MLAILIVADQLADVCAAGSEPAAHDLLVNERLQRAGKGDVHGFHVERLATLARNGKKGIPQPSPGIVSRYTTTVSTPTSSVWTPSQ